MVRLPRPARRRGQQATRDERRKAFAESDLLEQFVRALQAQFRSDGLQSVFRNFLEHEGQIGERLREQTSGRARLRRNA